MIAAESLFVQRNGRVWLMPSRTQIGQVYKNDARYVATCSECGWGIDLSTRGAALDDLVQHWRDRGDVS